MEPGIPWWGGGGSFAAGKQGHALRQKGAEQKSTQQSQSSVGLPWQECGKFAQGSDATLEVVQAD